MQSLLYSAELIEEDGIYWLTVTDHMRDSVQTAEVSKRAVEKLPVFLSMLNSERLGSLR